MPVGADRDTIPENIRLGIHYTNLGPYRSRFSCPHRQNSPEASNQYVEHLGPYPVNLGIFTCFKGN
jgi:hypothetical protein